MTDRPQQKPPAMPTDKPPDKPYPRDLDQAHREAGDGVLPGSVPAGLTVDELLKRAKGPAKDSPATG